MKESAEDDNYAKSASAPSPVLHFEGCGVKTNHVNIFSVEMS